MSALLVNFAKGIDPAVEVISTGEFKRAGSIYREICDVQRANNYNTEMADFVNLSLAPLRTEEGAVEYENLLQGDNNILVQYEYTVGTKISDKLVRWNKVNIIKKLLSGAPNAVGRRREFDITKLLERGDATSYTHSNDGSTVIDLTGGDGVATFSASHSSVRTSTTQNNVIRDGTVNNMDLAEDALEAAETVTRPSITDDSDQVVELKYSDLFVSRKKSWVAQRLLKTAQGRVGTPNNDYNLVYGRYRFHELAYMDTARDEYWFLKDSELNAQGDFMTYLEGHGLDKDGPFVDFDTKSVKYSWSLEFAAGHNLWQSYAGSQGDNT